MNNKNLKVKLVAIARDEAAYLPEWIFHHLTFGFDEIEVYVNNTTDNTYQVIEQISKYYPVFATDADSLFKKSGENFQLRAYENAVEKAQIADFTHIMFLDIDEFWTPADFKTDIKGALQLYSYPQALSLNWLIHCDESNFSPCYKSTLQVLPNPHVKTVFDLSTTWDKIEIHNIVGDSIQYKRGDGSTYDFNGSAHCGLTDADCITHDFFIIHRMYRSQMEYISLLGRGRANKIKLKDNRNGYYVINERTKSINIDAVLLASYSQKYSTFVEQCQLSKLNEQSKEFIESRYQRVITWAKQADTIESSVFDRLFQNIDIPEIQAIRKRYESEKMFIFYKDLISNTPSFNSLMLHIFSKLLLKVRAEKWAIAVYLKANTLNTKADTNGVVEILNNALKKTNFPKKNYADIYREIAIQFYKEKDIQQAFFFISKAKQLRPNGPHITKLYEKYLSEIKFISSKKCIG